MPRSEIAESYGSSIFRVFFLSKAPKLFSIVAPPIYIPTNGVRGFPSFHTLSSIWYL